MNGMREEVIYWIWMGGTALFATLFAVATVICAVLAFQRKRTAFLGLGGAFLLATTVSVLANPVANLLLFHVAADRNTHRLVADMKSECPVGHDARVFIAKFGQPSRKQTVGEREIWTYDANPWWMVGWTEIEIGVVSNKIEGHWLDD